MLKETKFQTFLLISSPTLRLLSLSSNSLQVLTPCWTFYSIDTNLKADEGVELKEYDTEFRENKWQVKATLFGVGQICLIARDPSDKLASGKWIILMLLLFLI